MVDFFEETKKFMLKLQNLSESKKKIIVIIVIAVAGLILSYLQILSTGKSIAKIEDSLRPINASNIESTSASDDQNPTTDNQNPESVQGSASLHDAVK
jgi:uncharacterized membrane protein